MKKYLKKLAAALIIIAALCGSARGADDELMRPGDGVLLYMACWGKNVNDEFMHHFAGLMERYGMAGYIEAVENVDFPCVDIRVSHSKPIRARLDHVVFSFVPKGETEALDVWEVRGGRGTHGYTLMPHSQTAPEASKRAPENLPTD